MTQHINKWYTIKHLLISCRLRGSSDPKKCLHLVILRDIFLTLRATPKYYGATTTHETRSTGSGNIGTTQQPHCYNIPKLEKPKPLYKKTALVTNDINAVYAIENALNDIQKYFRPNSSGICAKMRPISTKMLLTFLRNTTFQHALSSVCWWRLHHIQLSPCSEWLVSVR